MPDPADTPAAAETLTEVLDRMEAWRGHPGTLPLHDAAWALLTALREGSPTHDARRALAEALAAWPAHPAAPLLGSSAGRGDVPRARPRSVEDVVAGIRGLPALPDPAEALERHLHDLSEHRRLLERRVDDLTLRLGQARRGLDLAVGVLVVVALLALVGWGAALGWFAMPVTPPLPVPDEAAIRPPEPRPETPR